MSNPCRGHVKLMRGCPECKAEDLAAGVNRLTADLKRARAAMTLAREALADHGPVNGAGVDQCPKCIALAAIDAELRP